jgi:hypothetical protein
LLWLSHKAPVKAGPGMCSSINSYTRRPVFGFLSGIFFSFMALTMATAKGLRSIKELSFGPFLSIVSIRCRYNFVIYSQLYLPGAIFSCSPLMLISFNSNPIAIESSFASAAVAAAFFLSHPYCRMQKLTLSILLQPMYGW